MSRLIGYPKLDHSKGSSTNDITTNGPSVIWTSINGTYQKEDDATLPFTSLCNITKRSDEMFRIKRKNLNVVRRDPYAVISEEQALCLVFRVQQSEFSYSKHSSTNGASVNGTSTKGTYKKEDDATLLFSSLCNMAKSLTKRFARSIGILTWSGEIPMPSFLKKKLSVSFLERHKLVGLK